MAASQLHIQWICHNSLLSKELVALHAGAVYSRVDQIKDIFIEHEEGGGGLKRGKCCSKTNHHQLGQWSGASVETEGFANCCFLFDPQNMECEIYIVENWMIFAECKTSAAQPLVVHCPLC